MPWLTCPSDLGDATVRLIASAGKDGMEPGTDESLRNELLSIGAQKPSRGNLLPVLFGHDG